MKSMQYKFLFLFVVVSCSNMDAVTSLFESKDMTYEPYEYKKSEFNAMSISKRLDCMLQKLAEFENKAADKNFNVNHVAYHQLVKAIHAAHAVENRLKLNLDQKAKMQSLDLEYSKKKRFQVRLDNLKVLLTNLYGKKFETKAQESALYEVYKDLEKGLYAIDKKGYGRIINTESTPLFYE